MPKMAAKKKKLADLKDGLGIKHSCALALLDHPDPDERETLIEYLAEYIDITTYREAVDYLRQEQNNPFNQVICEACGWTGGMACPECPGCGCYKDQCSGWRHHEYAHDEDDDPDRHIYCFECGAGSSGPYEECTCFYVEDEDEGQEQEASSPEPLEPAELASAGGWGSNSGLPFSPAGS